VTVAALALLFPGGNTGGAAALYPGAAAAPPTVGSQSQAGTIDIGSLVAPSSLDPTISDSQAVDEVFDNNVYEHLVAQNSAGAVVPGLASSWTVSRDRKTYVFTLRSGVQFSNGDPLNPQVVAFSLLRAAAPGSRYPDAYLLSNLQSVVATGSNKVTVTLTLPSYSFLYTLASTSDGIIVDPGAVATIASEPVGTGPFVFSGWTHGKDLTLVRNPDYWGTPARVDEVTFDYFTSPSVENSALLAGQINVIDDEGAPAYLPGFRSDPQFQVVTGQTERVMQLTLNNSVIPLTEATVRQAIAYATNRAAIDNVVAGGSALQLGAPAISADPWYLDLTAQHSYNLTKARQLLAAAGYQTGFDIPLAVPAVPQDQLAASVLAAQLDQVGIHVDETTVSYAAWVRGVVDQGNFSMTIGEQTGGRQLSAYANPSAYFRPADASVVGPILSIGDYAATQAAWIGQERTALRLVGTDAVNDWLYQVPEMLVAQSDVTGLPTSELSDSFPLASLAITAATS